MRRWLAWIAVIVVCGVVALFIFRTPRRELPFDFLKGTTRIKPAWSHGGSFYQMQGKWSAFVEKASKELIDAGYKENTPAWAVGYSHMFTSPHGPYVMMTKEFRADSKIGSVPAPGWILIEISGKKPEPGFLERLQAWLGL